ncbi:MAG: AAA family ATPase, partial [Elusimicrobiota bacterium]
VKTTLLEENLLNEDKELEITKIFLRSNPKKPKVKLTVMDYQDKFNNLCSLKEKELNSIGDELGLEMSKAGRSITNKGKRGQIRKYAEEHSIPKASTQIDLSDDLVKMLLSYLPKLELFRADTRLGVDETSFQSEFRQIVTDTVQSIPQKSEIEEKIKNGLSTEFTKIHQKLLQHTDVLTDLKPYPKFSWDKLVAFDLKGVDEDGIEASLNKRGAGIRRMLMVAFFQYLADRKVAGKEINLIYAIEEPEAFIHPGLQRELAKSLNELCISEFQILITSHSPVFAGFSPKEDLVLLKRTGGTAEAIQSPALNLEEVADELGVEPSDQICGFKACVFVEGPKDILFWETVFKKLKANGNFPATPAEKNIGFIPYGGSGLKHYIDRKALKNINRKYLVIVDSDRKNISDIIPQRKLNWKQECESDGGKFFILRKRAIENYLHPEALKRDGKLNSPFDDFTDMKSLFGENVIKTIEKMTAEEIIEKVNTLIMV